MTTQSGDVMTVACETIKFVDTQIAKQPHARPLFIFISGPQGSGKSYNSLEIYSHLRHKHSELNTAYVSIDDFYLTHADQLDVNSAFPQNEMLQGRGLPGTHDLPLLREFLDRALSSDAGTDTLSVPRYDKSKFHGQGDRSLQSQVVQLPLDVVIMEGWFLGFNPLSQEELKKEYESVDHTSLKQHELEHLSQINKNLGEYSRLLWRNPCLSSVGIIFSTNDIGNVYEWRLQQEHQLLLNEGRGMTDEQVHKFVDRYYPCYELYYNRLIHQAQLGELATLKIGIDLQRNVTFVSENEKNRDDK